MEHQPPNIAFIGLSEKIRSKINFVEGLNSIDIIDLRKEIFFPIFPINIGSFSILISIYNIGDFSRHKNIQFICKNNQNKKLFFFDLKLTDEEQPTKDPINEVTKDRQIVAVSDLWTNLAIKIPKNIIIHEPGELNFYLRVNNEEVMFGVANLIFAKSAPLSEDRIRALKSNPSSSKHIKLIAGCSKCSSEVIFRAGLEKPKLENNELWYEDLGESYSCECGKFQFSLEYIRQGLHSFLGNNMNAKSNSFNISRLYEKGGLKSINQNLKDVLGIDPNEAIMQKFFEDNPILFHRLAASQIIPEAPILNRHRADFVILSKTGTLFLIELEKPGKRILKKNGGRTADFNHPFDQIRDWIFAFEEHKYTILDSLNINIKEVSDIKGLVIIGRDSDCEMSQLRKVKSTNTGNIDFWTYDDVIGSMETLIKNFDEL